MMDFHEILARFGEHSQHGREYRVRCPAHDDRTPSLDISEGNVGPLFYCRSGGCQTVDILAAVGLTWGDVLPQRNGQPDVWDHVYEYRERDGTLSYRVYRRGSGKGKTIRQQAADGTWSLKGILPIPYRLPELDGDTILVAEGEKVVDALMSAGYSATTNSGGAGNWRDSDSAALQAIGITSLIILPDNDAPGEKHAAVVEASAGRHGIATRRVYLPGLPPAGDAYDWLQKHTADELHAILTAPVAESPPLLLPDLSDAVDVVAQGQEIASVGIQYVVDGLIPEYGMLGFLVAQAKVGKTSLGHALASSVSRGEDFIERAVKQRRVLVLAAEDPPEYTAYLARHLTVDRGQITFSRTPLQLNAASLALILATIQDGGYGLVLISSWQAVVSTLVKDENDNAGSVQVVEAVKQATRHFRVPWLVDSHAGKGEDQGDLADPTRAMRGASAAAGAADFMISLRYADGPFSNRRRLSGKGRFVNFEPISIRYDINTGVYESADVSTSAFVESTWRLIQETGAVTTEWNTVIAIGIAAGLGDTPKEISGNQRRQITAALKDRPGIERETLTRGGRTLTRYRVDK